MTSKISFALALALGLGLIFIGARFLISPEVAEAGYGIHFNEQGDYSFHYIKGIRDLYTGIIFCILLFTRQLKALGITLLVGTIIPVADMLIVLGKPYNGIAQAMPHISAILLCLMLGIRFLFHKPMKAIV